MATVLIARTGSQSLCRLTAGLDDCIVFTFAIRSLEK
jgi:hypothetical protein